MNVQYPQVAALGTILGMWAHPDDESWCAGGIFASAIKNGQKVVCVTATKGQAGFQPGSGWNEQTLAKARQQELEASNRIIGIADHQWLDYTDGHCHEADDQVAAAKLVPIIERVKPDTIITFGPDGLTGHGDHKAISRWTDIALGQAKLAKPPRVLHKVESKEWYQNGGQAWAKPFNLYFMTDHPPLVPEADIDFLFHLPPEIMELKFESLKAHLSQTESLFAKSSKAELEKAFGLEGFSTVLPK